VHEPLPTGEMFVHHAEQALAGRFGECPQGVTCRHGRDSRCRSALPYTADIRACRRHFPFGSGSGRLACVIDLRSTPESRLICPRRADNLSIAVCEPIAHACLVGDRPLMSCARRRDSATVIGGGNGGQQDWRREVRAIPLRAKGAFTLLVTPEHL